jgi:hypothetical protein
MELKDVVKLLELTQGKAEAGEHPFKIGEKYAIRTVTMYYVGKLEAIYDGWLVLSTCAY